MKALEHPSSLVVRTNITGFRGRAGKPTFIEWALDALKKTEPVTGFGDFFTSTIDAATFADLLFVLSTTDTRGLIHLAGDHVSSKYEFLSALKTAMDDARAPLVKGSVRALEPPRAESLGLDCGRAKAVLSRPLPDLEQVVANLIDERRALSTSNKEHVDHASL